MSNKKKKSWKNNQRTRQARQQGTEKVQPQRKEGKKRSAIISKGKIIGAISLIVLVVGVYAAIQYQKSPIIQESFSVVYIRTDGSMDPSNASISSVENNHYVFTSDIYGSLVIEKDNIIVDGTNHILRGQGTSSSVGVNLSGRNNVTIKNLRLKEFGCGFYLDSSNSNVLSQNNMADINNGVEIMLSSNNILNKNSITNCGGAIGLSESSGNSLTQNSLAGNQYSISLTNSSHNVISENTITDSEGAIGFSQSSYNSVSGNRLNYNSLSLYMDNSSSNILSGNTLTNNDQAIRISKSFSNNVTQNVLASNQYSISLENSLNNSILGNALTNSTYAISLSQSSINSISENYLDGNQYGMYIMHSSANFIIHNGFGFNARQVFSSDSQNAWDGGSTSAGNYWGDYQYLYPNARELASSGIWDTPYVIDGNNKDNYPLVNP